MTMKEISRIDINEKEVPLFHSIDKKDRENETRRVKATRMERESIE